MVSFLMAGQSNMAGRGRLDDLPPIKNDALFVLRNGRWQPLHEPVNFDRPFSGTCLATSFADAYAKHCGCEVGLIPCADGGTTLSDWAEGGQLFDHCALQAGLAHRISAVRGMLWHQGESASQQEADAAAYLERFLPLMGALRRACGLEAAPLVVGELGRFLADSPEGRHAHFEAVNRAIAEAARVLPRCALASSEGLASNGDYLHFDAASLRVLGKRYFEKFVELEQACS